MKSFKYTINGNVYKVVINAIEDTIADVEVNGTPYKVEMNKPAKKQVVTVKRPVQSTAPAVSRPQTAAVAGALKSPLPGIILDVACKTGDAVKKGQKLFILEAMKMENVINADRDGVIKDVKVNKGDSVLEGASLAIIE
ncbi:MAG: biotin/lipoyl-binding protein [Dysgonamonadaceae bacterium]|jgi:biotin carboxyl carrier protein|nr:biotin/lipoyl-binding protein [Dysgonamonadaceae bacterium]